MSVATDDELERIESPEDQAAIDAANAIAEGSTIDDLAENGGADTPTKPMQIPLPGTGSTISGSAGGAEPTSSTARLLGGSMPIAGQFAKGDSLTLRVEAKVVGVEFVDKTDDWGRVETTERRHKLRMISVRQFGD